MKNISSHEKRTRIVTATRMRSCPHVLSGTIAKTMIAHTFNKSKGGFAIMKVSLDYHTRIPACDSLYAQQQSDGSFIQKKFHGGRTDHNFGHHVMVGGNATGPYHFHHTNGPHFPCSRSGLSRTHIITNPYTGRRISLGNPHVFDNQTYYPLNLVAMALTGNDNIGVTLEGTPTMGSFNNVRGNFHANNRGTSRAEALGEAFTYAYPTNLLGRLRTNETFFAEGDRGGRIQLLCHNRQGIMNPVPSYAWISVDSICQYMLDNGFFTSLTVTHNGAWEFEHISPLRQVTWPRRDTPLHVGELLFVNAAIRDVASASLFINGHIIETTTTFIEEHEVAFTPIRLTVAIIGLMNIRVEAINRSGVTVEVHGVLPRVTFPMAEIEILLPQSGNEFNVGDELNISARIANAADVELTVRGQSFNPTVTPKQTHVVLPPIILTGEHEGELEINARAWSRRTPSEGNRIALDSSIINVLIIEPFVRVYARVSVARGDLTPVQEEANAKYIFDYLQPFGWSMGAIASVLGNIYQECNMNPGAWQGNRNTNLGFGLLQWTPAWTKILRRFGSNEEDVTRDEIIDRVHLITNNNPQLLMDTQLNFFLDDLQPTASEWLGVHVQTHYDRLPWSNETPMRMSVNEFINSSHNPADLALVFHAHYMRSADRAYNLQRRANFATKWYDFLRNL